MKRLLIVLFFMVSLGVQAQIAYNPNAVLGATSAVDYNRITEDYLPEGEIIFYVGELTFNATITNTKPPYGAHELSQIIKEVMNDMGVTEGMLENIDRDLNRRDEITSQQWHDLALKALDIIASSDLNPVSDAYAYGRDKINAARQGQTFEQIFQGDDVKLMDHLVDQGMDKIQGEVEGRLLAHATPAQMAGISAGKKIAGWVMMMKAAIELGWDLGNFLNEYHIWDRQEYLDRMMERQLAKELFYDACKRRVINELEQYYADGQWQINVQDGIRRSDAKLFGIPITQIWMLEGKLVKVENAAPGKYGLCNASWKGRYEGPMTLTASHASLSDFDNTYRTNVILSKWLPFRTFMSLFTVNDHTLVNVALGDKVLKADKLVLNIRETQGQRLARFIGQMEEKPVSFTSQHRGDFLLQSGAWNNGQLNLPHIHGDINMKFTFTSGVEGDYGRKLCLYLQQQKNTNITKISAPHVNRTYDFTSQMPNFAVNGPVRFMVDNTLFTSLEKDCGYIITPRAAEPAMGSPAPTNQGRKRNAATADNAPIRVSAPGEPVTANPEDTYEWLADMPAEVREPIERGNACVAQGQLPAKYAWLLPKRLQEDDFVSLTDKNITLSFDERTDATFQQLVQRAKANGFGPSDDGMDNPASMGFYEGTNNDGEVCTIIYSSANQYLTVTVGEPEQVEFDPSQVTQEIDLSDIPELQGVPTMSPKMKKLQKRMTELSLELQAHPERADKIQKEMERLGKEMEQEARKMLK